MLALFFYVFSTILLPFVVGMVLAYFLDPVADRLERLGCLAADGDHRHSDHLLLSLSSSAW